MTYFVATERYGRIEVEFDSKRFLSDLAAALGGTDVDPEYQGGRFSVGELAMYLRQGWGAKARRVTINCGTTDKSAHQLAYARGRVPDFPEISIDPDRPLDAVVKDIRKRLIEPAAEPLAALKSLASEQADTVATLRAHAERINASYPGSVTLRDETKSEASFYLNSAGCYLSGRLNTDGSLYVDRLGTVPSSKLDALLKLLAA